MHEQVSQRLQMVLSEVGDEVGQVGPRAAIPEGLQAAATAGLDRSEGKSCSLTAPLV